MNRQLETAPRDDEEWRPEELEITDEKIRVCPRCNTPLKLRKPARPPHWAEFWCPTCCRSCGWAATPDCKLGSFYRLPYGCFAGRTLDQVAATARGLDYLKWVSHDLKDEHIRKSVARYLEYKLQESKRSSESEPVLTG